MEIEHIDSGQFIPCGKLIAFKELIQNTTPHTQIIIIDAEEEYQHMKNLEMSAEMIHTHGKVVS